MKKLNCFVFLFVVFASGLLSAQSNNQPDQRVADMLKTMNIDYVITDNGNFEIEYELASGRTQYVFIMSETQKYRGMEVREVWSNAGVLDEDPEVDLLYELMQESGSNKIGAWALEENDEGILLYYSIKAPVSHTVEDLRQLIAFAAEVADSQESYLFEDDVN
ncbi:hypothetical protein [Gracilinema caldarium]|uniref:hypothetical protein n=1 Tax=Gracilinema caldarium TaxID=215591 RepID=UPI0026EC91CB|nr:hypothetical protein [Gracilinema caldarium]